MDGFSDRLKLFSDHTVIDWHEHVWPDRGGKLNADACQSMVAGMRRIGIDKAACSAISTDPKCTPESFRILNDATREAMERHPDVILGMLFINPAYQREALCEIDRCVCDLGMTGVKLYHQYVLDEPVLFPIIEKCIALDIPILMHAGKLCHQPETQPRLSGGQHFANVSRRYPEAKFIMAHIGGGGDWFWQIKAIADTPGVLTDMSGSVFDAGMLEYAVALLGADRILFGTDGSYSSCVGKMLAAKIPFEDKLAILKGDRLYENVERRRA